MPSPETVKEVLEQIRKRTANHDYFFSQLKSTEWIQPLDEAGLFNSPPAAEHEGDTIRFPFWPESQYLARMAAKSPEQVAAVMMRIPETDNVRVHEDLVKAASNLPPKLAAIWAAKESAWISQQEHLYFLLPEVVGELIAYLARSGELRASEMLAGSLLTIRKDPGKSRQARGLFDSWSYEQILKKHIPELVRNSGLHSLGLLCRLLESALDVEQEGRETGDDYSHIWRPAIEPHEQNLRHDDLFNLLVDAVRDNALMLLESGTEISSVINLLEQRERPIFRRIVIHLLGLKHQTAFDFAERYVVNRDHFFDVGMRLEYSRLVNNIFPHMDERAKAKILDWVRDGPSVVSPEGDDLEMREEAKEYWQAQRLQGLRGHLPPVWEARYEEIVAKVGEPEHPDFSSHTSFWVGPTSPREQSELEQMTVQEIGDFLRTWKGSHKWQEATPEGLGRLLQSVISKAPERFVKSLDIFREVDPTYARAIVHGVTDSVKGGISIEWGPVLEYLTWIAFQPREQLRDTSRFLDHDPHWGWARKAAVSLLSVGFEKNLLDISFREAAWEIISAIAEDPDPTPEDEEDSSMNPATRSINTTRGEALHAVVKYALWVRRAAMAAGLVVENNHFNMTYISEVREKLGRHLETGLDPSAAVRAVYGQWFPYLVSLDKVWTEQNIQSIYPQDQEALRKAAWNTYLAFNPAYEESFRLLRSEYVSGIARLADSDKSDDGWLARPGERIGQHLISMIGRGVVSWLGDEDLVVQYFKIAPIKDVSHAIASVGRMLRDDEKGIPAEFMGRLCLFWEALMNFVSEHATERAEMLKPFGWWFASRRFDTAWSLVQLERVIKISGGIDPDFMVVEVLAEIVDEYPEQSFVVLRLLSQQARLGWSVLDWKDEAMQILQAALANSSTQAEAESLIHELGAKGYLRFRELLSPH